MHCHPERSRIIPACRDDPAESKLRRLAGVASPQPKSRAKSREPRQFREFSRALGIWLKRLYRAEKTRPHSRSIRLRQAIREANRLPPLRMTVLSSPDGMAPCLLPLLPTSGRSGAPGGYASLISDVVVPQPIHLIHSSVEKALALVLVLARW